jgi:hypothetical protein
LCFPVRWFEFTRHFRLGHQMRDKDFTTQHPNAVLKRRFVHSLHACSRVAVWGAQPKSLVNCAPRSAICLASRGRRSTCRIWPGCSADRSVDLIENRIQLIATGTRYAFEIHWKGATHHFTLRRLFAVQSGLHDFL